MKKAFLITLIFLLGISLLPNKEAKATPAVVIEVVDEFEEVSKWRPFAKYCSGDTEGSLYSQSSERWRGRYSMKIDYKFNTKEEDNLTLANPGLWDLRRFDEFEFWVKGDGKPVALYIYFMDKKGNFLKYGPGGGINEDFRISSTFWKRLGINFEEHPPKEAKGKIDLSSITTVGIRLSDKLKRDTPYSGTIFIGRMRLIAKVKELSLNPKTFSPNGDGVNDTTLITYYLAEPASVSARIYDQEDHPQKTFLENLPTLAGKHQIIWNGKDERGKVLSDGTYICRIVGVTNSAKIISFSGELKIDTKGIYRRGS